MKLEELITLHNRELERRAAADVFLPVRLKARLYAQAGERNGVWRIFRRKSLVWLGYGVLFLLLTLGQYLILEKAGGTSRSDGGGTILTVSGHDFQGDYPGSLSGAWQGALK